MASEYYDGYGGVEDFMPENQIDYGDLGTNVYLNKALSLASAMKRSSELATINRLIEAGLATVEDQGRGLVGKANEGIKNALIKGAFDVGSAALGSKGFGSGPGFGYDDVVYGKISDPTADIQRALGPNTEFKMYPGSFTSN